MDDIVIYYIVWSNVSILTAVATPFPDKLAPAAPPTLPTDFTTELRVSTTNVTSTIAAVYNDSNTQAADITCLIASGIEVDVEQAALENSISDTTPCTRKWELPTTCPHKADSNIKDEKGKWKIFLGPSLLTWSCLMSSGCACLKTLFST